MPPPSDPGLPLTLVLHAADCSLFDVAAPPGLKAQEYGLLLEEHLLSEPDEQRVLKLGQSRGRLQLLVCNAALLQSWCAWLHESGLKVQRLVFDVQLLPPVPADTVMGWKSPAATLLVKAPMADAPGAVLSWPDRQLPPLPDTWQVGGWHEFEHGIDELEALAQGNTSAVSWLQRSRLPLTPGLRLPAGLKGPLKLTILAGLACLLATAVHQWRGHQLERQQLTQRLGLMADVRGEQLQRHLTRQLKVQRRALQQLAETELLVTSLSEWLHQHPEWRLQALGNNGETGFSARLLWQGEVDSPSLPVLKDSFSSVPPLAEGVAMSLEIVDGRSWLRLVKAPDAEVRT